MLQQEGASMYAALRKRKIKNSWAKATETTLVFSSLCADKASIFIGEAHKE